MTDQFPREVKKREDRKLEARKHEGETVWFGLGMFGLVGWAIAIPTVAAIFLGVWIDLTWPSRYSWTLMMLVAGLGVGCSNAWYWLQKERRKIIRPKESDHD